jgi:hypothetical protein
MGDPVCWEQVSYFFPAPEDLMRIRVTANVANLKKKESDVSM